MKVYNIQVKFLGRKFNVKHIEANSEEEAKQKVIDNLKFESIEEDKLISKIKQTSNRIKNGDPKRAAKDFVNFLKNL